MPIRLVEIQGDLTQVTKEDVLTVLRAQSRNDSDDEESINFLTTDLSGLEQSLEQVPWILKAQVRRVWPDKLVIDVTEQQAVAFWNSTQLVNQYGDTFTPETMPEMALPILTGPEAELSTMLERFAELQQKFEAAGHQLHELHLTQRRSWQMKLTTGIELKLGRKDLLSRVSRFIELYPLLESESDAPIERVDLRYDTGMAVLRQQRHASLK
jgi:cell division protein FtsQ